MYLVCGTKPDIFFVVGQFSRHNTNPKKVYFQIVKRVVWYLCGTIEIDLIYGQKLNNQIPKEPLSICLISFADSSFAGDSEKQKSVRSYYFFFNKAVVSWCGEKQRIISTLTTKAKYIAFGHVVGKKV